MSRVLVILNLDRIDPARLISPRTLPSELNKAEAGMRALHTFKVKYRRNAPKGMNVA